MSNIERRDFLKRTAIAGIGVGLTSRVTPVLGMGAIAPSDLIRVGVMGVNSRGNVLAQSFDQMEGCEVAYICDVDERAVESTIQDIHDNRQQQETAANGMGNNPEGVTDLRYILDDQEVDALVIAASNHWHTPATLLALDAGKHVYVEKPASYSAEEAVMLVEAQRRHGDLLVQMGNQQRSNPRSRQMVQEIHEGVIGEPYFAHTWYANTRGSIGNGQQAPIPEWLDYELWQGPAPHVPYRDNVVHYNWHWFRHWGGGEIANNGSHEIDIARWALGVDIPSRVTSSGGRYHYDDDWEYFDTQVASFEFGDEKSITWHGRSCNGKQFHNRGRGTTIHGTEGTVLLDRASAIIYDEDQNEVRRLEDDYTSGDQIDTVESGSMTDQHIFNFLQALRGNGQLNSPIDVGQRSTMLCHLGNIAQIKRRELQIDSWTGRIIGDGDAMELWGRDEYEDGWWNPRT